jgi:hypothetical protein
MVGPYHCSYIMIESTNSSTMCAVSLPGAKAQWWHCTSSTPSLGVCIPGGMNPTSLADFQIVNRRATPRLRQVVGHTRLRARARYAGHVFLSPPIRSVA